MLPVQQVPLAWIPDLAAIIVDVTEQLERQFLVTLQRYLQQSRHGSTVVKSSRTKGLT